MTILRAWSGVGAFLHGGALLVFVLFVVLGISNAYDDGEGVVTCGSIVKLRDSQTGVNLRSLRDITYGGGSNQQVVTGGKKMDSRNDLWLVKEPHQGIPCEVGRPIKCGDIIRLEHVGSGMNLHSHQLPATLAYKHYEGSGEGNIWHRGEENRISLKHAKTQLWLSTQSKYEYNRINCGPNCPIMGNQEVTSVKGTSGSTWYADQGVFLHHTEECSRK